MNQANNSSNQPISMLEMAFNEINPYRDNKLAAAQNSDSFGVSGPIHIREEDSLGGSVHNPNHDGLSPDKQTLASSARESKALSRASE